VAIAAAIALASAINAVINNAIDLISAITLRCCLGSHRLCQCCHRIAITIAATVLPLLASGRRHTSALLIFCFLIVDCVLPLPQLFALAAAAAAAMFIGPPTCPQRWESVRDALFVNRTRSSLLSLSSSLLLLLLLLSRSASKTLHRHSGEGGGAVAVEGDG
jgi:hypothetical protein